MPKPFPRFPGGVPRAPERRKTVWRSCAKNSPTSAKKLGELKARWVNEKSAIDKVRGAKEELERLRQESEIAERDGDYGKVAELRYGRIPNWKRK